MLRCITEFDGRVLDVCSAPGRKLLIGRTPPADVLLEDDSAKGLLSRKHALLRLEQNGKLTITDLGSLNGTWVESIDGQHTKLLPNQPMPLSPGSTVSLGGKETILDVSNKRRPNPFVFLYLGATPGAPVSSNVPEQQQVLAAQALETSGTYQQQQQVRHRQPVLQDAQQQAKSQQSKQGQRAATSGTDCQQHNKQCKRHKAPQATGHSFTAQENTFTAGDILAAAQWQHMLASGAKAHEHCTLSRAGQRSPLQQYLHQPQQQQVVAHQQQLQPITDNVSGITVQQQHMQQHCSQCANIRSDNKLQAAKFSDASHCQAAESAAPAEAAPAAACTVAGSPAAAATVEGDDDADKRMVSRSNLECPICKDLFVSAHILGCGHVFCGPCLTQWLERKRNCPACRAQVCTPPGIVPVMESLVADAMLKQGSESQERAARLQVWDAIKADTKQHWEQVFRPQEANGSRRAAAQQQPPKIPQGVVPLLTGQRAAANPDATARTAWEGPVATAALGTRRRRWHQQHQQAGSALPMHYGNQQNAANAGRQKHGHRAARRIADCSAVAADTTENHQHWQPQQLQQQPAGVHMPGGGQHSRLRSMRQMAIHAYIDNTPCDKTSVKHGSVGRAV